MFYNDYIMYYAIFDLIKILYKLKTVIICIIALIVHSYNKTILLLTT